MGVPWEKNVVACLKTYIGSDGDGRSGDESTTGREAEREGAMVSFGYARLKLKFKP